MRVDYSSQKLCQTLIIYEGVNRNQNKKHRLEFSKNPIISLIGTITLLTKHKKKGTYFYMSEIKANLFKELSTLSLGVIS